MIEQDRIITKFVQEMIRHDNSYSWLESSANKLDNIPTEDYFEIVASHFSDIFHTHCTNSIKPLIQAHNLAVIERFFHLILSTTKYQISYDGMTQKEKLMSNLGQFCQEMEYIHTAATDKLDIIDSVSVAPGLFQSKLGKLH